MIWRLTDDELKDLHRRTERRSHIVLGLMFAVILPSAVLDVWLDVLDVPKVGVVVLFVPLFVVGIVLHLIQRPMQWLMDRRGIDWDHA